MQQVAVIVIVIAATIFAVYRLPGAATRLRYAALLKRAGLRALGTWIESRELRAITSGGCKACGTATRNAVHKPK